MNTKVSKQVLNRLAVLLAITALTACGGGSNNSSSNNTNNTNTNTSPSGVITTASGSGGDLADGGNGGSITIYKGVGSGPVEILQTGSVDASFTPQSLTPNLGANPYTVMADTVVTLYSGSEPAAGTLYVQSGSGTLYLSDGDTTAFNSEEIITGLQISAATVLTLPLNSGSSASLGFSHDVYNQGTVKLVDQSPSQRGGFSLACSSYIADGNIDTAGRLEGQNGGDVNLSAAYSIINHGDIDSSGAANTSGDGGSGGSIYLFAGQFYIENSGDLLANGGDSDTSAAGYGNGITLEAQNGIRNAGKLAAYGGDGISGAGGGTSITLTVNQAGDILNSGMLDAHGGAATTVSGAGGGSITINTRGGSLLSNADLSTRGGDTTVTSGFYTAGPGGSINIILDGQGNFNGYEQNAGDLMLSGRIDAAGGDAPAGGDSSGGNGGSMNIQSISIYGSDEGQRLSLLGYHDIDSHGGVGLTGGNGNTLNIWNYPDSSGPFGQIPSGNIINEAALTSRGGDVATTATGSTNGGCHGEVWVDTRTDQINGSSPEGAAIVNSGAIAAGNGESLETGSPASCSSNGTHFMAYSGISNSGDIDTSGGNDRGSDGFTTGRGSNASDIIMQVAAGDISNSGTLTTNGGNGEYIAGHAQPVLMFADRISNSKAISAAGGDADPALAGSVGGNGAEVNLQTTTPGGVTNSASVTIDGGSGETAGTDGIYRGGGICIVGASGAC